jgi:hypothetical protein
LRADKFREKEIKKSVSCTGAKGTEIGKKTYGLGI